MGMTAVRWLIGLMIVWGATSRMSPARVVLSSQLSVSGTVQWTAPLAFWENPAVLEVRQGENLAEYASASAKPLTELGVSPLPEFGSRSALAPQGISLLVSGLTVAFGSTSYRAFAPRAPPCVFSY